MKIAIMGGIGNNVKCGVADYTSMLTEALINEGCDSITIGSDNHCDIKIKSWDNLFSYCKVLKKIKKRKIKILQLEYPAKVYGKSIAVNFVPLLAKFYGVKTVYTCHEYSNRSFLGKMRQFPSFLFSNKIIVVDLLFKKDLSKYFIFKNKLQFINIGSNIKKSTASELDIEKLRQKIAPKGEKIISYFGFINQYKCFYELVKAIAFLKSKKKLKSKLLIIGELDCKDSYHKKILQYIDKHDLHSSIYITGYVENNVGDFFRCSDFAVLPFYYGISTRNGSFLAAYQENIEILTSKPSGEFPYTDILFFKSNEYKDMAHAIEYLQEKENKKFNRKIDFSWKYIARKHIKIYKRLLGETGYDFKIK